MPKKTEIDHIKDKLRKSRLTKTNIKREDLLSTGCTLLNLASSGYPEGGIARGMYVFFVGDSSSGKTMFARTILAEATINPTFDNYRLIYDDVENGALMDTEKYFGKKLAERLEPPDKDEQGPIYSFEIEDFYGHLYRILNGKKPCIYVLDSMDALSSEYEGKKFQEKINAKKKGTKAKGDYGDGKAKINSGNIRRINSLLRDTGSILVVLNQTRDNIDANLFAPKKTRSGGHALTFYAGMEYWSSPGPAIKKSVKGKDRKIGITSRITIKKNRSIGKERTVEIPIHYSYGIDDIGGCVDYLLSENHWETSGKKSTTKTRRSRQSEESESKGSRILAPEFDFEGKRDDLIKKIENENRIQDLRELVETVWNEIELELEMDRPRRYE